MTIQQVFKRNRPGRDRPFAQCGHCRLLLQVNVIRIDNVLDGWGLSARVNWLVVNDKAGVGNGGQFAIGPSDSNIKQAWVDFPPTMHFDSAPQVSRSTRSASAPQRVVSAYPVQCLSVPTCRPSRLESVHAAPQVLVTPMGEDYDDVFGATVTRISTTGFGVNLRRIDQLHHGWGAELKLNWIALASMDGLEEGPTAPPGTPPRTFAPSAVRTANPTADPTADPTTTSPTDGPTDSATTPPSETYALSCSHLRLPSCHSVNAWVQ